MRATIRLQASRCTVDAHAKSSDFKLVLICARVSARWRDQFTRHNVSFCSSTPVSPRTVLEPAFSVTSSTSTSERLWGHLSVIPQAPVSRGSVSDSDVRQGIETAVPLVPGAAFFEAFAEESCCHPHGPLIEDSSDPQCQPMLVQPEACLS